MGSSAVEGLKACHPSSTTPGEKCLTYRIFAVQEGKLNYDPFTIANNNTADWGGELHYVNTTTPGREPLPEHNQNFLLLG